MGQLHPKTSQEPSQYVLSIIHLCDCVIPYILLLEPPSPSECEDIAMGQKKWIWASGFGGHFYRGLKGK